MANTLAPFGFRPVGNIDGMAPTYGHTQKRVASGDSTAIYRGDPVTQLTTGYVTRSTAGSNQIHGIFVGCEYLSTSLQRKVWKDYWPGSDATGDVLAQVISDPRALFRVQVNGSTPIGIADIGTNANFAVGTPSAGNTASGQSYATLDQASLGTGATLQFRIVNIITEPPGDNGTDYLSANNHVLVKLNNSDFNVAAGI
jgi:hypothetical protein